MNTNGGQAAQSAGLGTHSARGLVYFLASSSVAKVVTFTANIVLAYLLSKGDFGLVAIATSITALIQVIEQGGVADVLVQRRNFRVWAAAGFWLGVAMGTVSCLLIGVAAPITSAVFGEPKLMWLMLVLAPSSITNALSVVPRAKLARELRFRALAIINLAAIVVRASLAILFAALGFGAFSFVAPVSIAGAVMATFLWVWVRPPWSPKLYTRRWRYLIGDSTQLLLAEFFRALMDQSDNLLLKVFRTMDLVGIYFFGWNFSIQMLQLLAVNLTSILFPALNKLTDRPEAQMQGFLKAQRILAMVGISSCFLQASAARPFTYLILDPKWYPSIIVMQVLSIGMATRMITGSSFALLKSQGRFGTILCYRFGFFVLLASSVTAVLAAGGGVAAVSVAVAVVASLLGPVTMHGALRYYGAGWNEVARVLLPPSICGVLAVGPAWLIASCMASVGFGHFSQLVETVVVAVLLNALLARLWMRSVWDDLWRRVWRLLPVRVQPEAEAMAP